MPDIVSMMEFWSENETIVGWPGAAPFPLGSSINYSLPSGVTVERAQLCLRINSPRSNVALDHLLDLTSITADYSGGVNPPSAGISWSSNQIAAMRLADNPSGLFVDGNLDVKNAIEALSGTIDIAAVFDIVGGAALIDIYGIQFGIKIWFTVNTSDIAGDVWDEPLAGHIGAGSTGLSQNLIDDIEADTDNIRTDTTRLFDGNMGSVTDNSFADQLMNKDAGQNFDPATDSLEALRDITDVIDGKEDANLVNTDAIYVKVDAGTPSPTIPAQLTTMEASLVAEIDANQAILEIIRDDAKAMVTIPNPIVKFNGISRIDTVDDLPLLTGATTILMDANSSTLLNQDGGEIIIDKGLATEEYLEYTDITNAEMTLVNPTTQDHDDLVLILEITRVTFNLAIQRKNGLANIQADLVPSFSQDDLLGNTENSGNMTWDAGTESYYAELVFDALTRNGERLLDMDVVVDTVTRKYQSRIDLVDRPSTDIQLAGITGAIVSKAYAFNESGYLDLSGIFTAWTDEMVGPIKDGTGKFITGIKVQAILMDENKVPLLDHPHYEGFSDIFGTYRGSLEAGKYLFTWYKDNLKWKEEIRYINYP